MSGDLAILIPTFEGYRPLAELTFRLLDRYWEDLPRSYVCGVDRFDGAECLPPDPQIDPRDWMNILRHALGQLRIGGVSKVYLILDDHPPLALCHAGHLNRTLPAWMDELNAAYIGLYGWDHHRDGCGKILGSKYLNLMHQHRDYVWKFTVAPALWDLEKLEKMLSILSSAPDLKDRSAWRFESRAGRSDAPFPDEWREGSYRVCGHAMRAGSTSAMDRVAAWAAFLRGRFFRRFRMLVQQVGGASIRERIDRAYGWESLYFHGPYPLHINGIMRRGALNKELILNLEKKREAALAAEIESAVGKLKGRTIE